MKWKLLFQGETIKIYQKGTDKMLIVSEEEFTFQTLTKILKRPRKAGEKNGRCIGLS